MQMIRSCSPSHNAEDADKPAGRRATVGVLFGATGLSHRHVSILALVVTMAYATAFAAQIIPDNRKVAWQGNVGVVGGIPTVTTIFTNLYPTGGDDGDMVRVAMARCPSNQVVM